MTIHITPAQLRIWSVGYVHKKTLESRNKRFIGTELDAIRLSRLMAEEAGPGHMPTVVELFL